MNDESLMLTVAPRANLFPNPSRSIRDLLCLTPCYRHSNARSTCQIRRMPSSLKHLQQKGFVPCHAASQQEVPDITESRPKSKTRSGRGTRTKADLALGRSET